MDLFSNVFANKQLRLLNHTNESMIFSVKNDALLSFALEDAIATAVGEKVVPPTIRLWVHDRTLVLGIPDSRLSNLYDGVHYMRQLNYDVVIRNSGGLAVLLDRNVLNISFLLPGKNRLSIHDGYDLMYYFTKKLFESEKKDILAYEIKGSYCPGDYDLSIDGKKFAGISQRRVRNGIAVQMYLDIAGSSYERAMIVKQFYHLAKSNEDSSFTYPDVNPQVMASINELMNTNFTVQHIIERIESIFNHVAKHPMQTNLIEKEKQLFSERLTQMEKRNEKIQSL